MRVKIAVFFLFSLLLWGGKVEIVSDEMQAEDAKKEVHFIRNVVIKQMESWIKGDEAIVYFDENNETKMYKVIGSVTFEFKEEVNHYKGKADTATYTPKDSKYILEGNAVVDDLVNKRHIVGNLINLDLATGQADVFGNKKEPVKFIFQTQDKEKKHKKD